MTANAGILALLLAAVSLPASASIPPTPPLTEKPHQGIERFALAPHRGQPAVNLLIAPRFAPCVCDEGRRSRCTGKERDAETGLDYFGARYFSGAQGRFTSPDKPFNDQFPEDPQSWNLYAYVRNNPLKMVDEDGKSATLAGALLGGLVRGGTALIQGRSGREVVAATSRGVFEGALLGSVIDTGGVTAVVAAGALGGVGGGLIERGITGQQTTLSNVVKDAAEGSVAGFVGGTGAQALKSTAKAGISVAVNEAASTSASPRVQVIADQIEQGGFKVVANPKTPNQTGNVTITQPGSSKQLNIRVETGPTPQGNRPHANVQVMRPNQRNPNKLKEESNVHIYE